MSYLDYDLGYEAGYETSTPTTRRPSRKSTRFAPEGSQVSYAMEASVLRGGGATSPRTSVVDRASDVYRQVREQALQVGDVAHPDIAGASDDLSQVEQSQGYEDLPAAGNSDMDFSIEDAATDRQRAAMDTVAGDEGLLAGMGFNAGERAMFREQYLGRSREELMTMVGIQGDEDPADRPGRIRTTMMGDYVGDLVPEVQRRFAPGTITEPQARAIATEAIRRQGSLEDYQAPGAGETPTVENSTRRRILTEIRTIPQGATEVDQPIYRDAVAQARQRFTEQSRDIFSGIDRRYYGNHRRGNERATTDAQRFLFHRGIQDSPAEIQRLLSDREGLTSQLTQFSQRVRGSETFAQEIDRRVPAAPMDDSSLNRQQRFQRGMAREEREAVASRERETREYQTQVQDRQREEDRADRMGQAAFNHVLAQDQEQQRFANQMTQASIQGLQQMMGQTLGQLQQAAFGTSQQIFQGTAQMLPRAPDASQWYGNASGQPGRAA